MRSVDNGYVCVGAEDIWEISVPFSHFAVNLKLLQKICLKKEDCKKKILTSLESKWKQNFSVEKYLLFLWN